MQKRLQLLLAALLFAPLSFAEPAPAPDPVPAKDDIPALIKQLGDDSPKVRDQASEKLRHIGADALPALAEAKKNEDAEVVSRAQTISKQIDEDLHPKPKVDPNGATSGLIFGNRGQRVLVGGVNGIGAGNMQIRITSAVNNGSSKSVSISKTNAGTVKDTTVTENGKTTKIHEDNAGISVTISEMKDGKEVSETTKAKDAETLEKENPKIFEIYEKNSKDDVQINGLNGAIRLQNNAVVRQREMERKMLDVQKKAEEDLQKLEKDAEEIIRQQEKEKK